MKNKILVRVRYYEVDSMGYLHHGNYPGLFELGRTELLRENGLSYREMEEKGFILPVRKINIEYFQPAHYDELISIETELLKFEGIRLEFKYTVRNENNNKLCEGYTTLVFADGKTGKPTRAPKFFLDVISN